MPTDLLELWARSKVGHPTQVPPIPQTLHDNLLPGEVAYLLNAANACKLRSHTIRWPKIPTLLTREVEKFKDEEAVMKWEVDLKEAVFDQFGWLRVGISKHIIETVVPALPKLKGNYSRKEMCWLYDYGLEVGRAYLLLVPDIQAFYCDIPGEEMATLQMWMRKVYYLYTTKPEVPNTPKKVSDHRIRMALPSCLTDVW